MTYRETKYIINEVEKLIDDYESKSSVRRENYWKVIPNKIYPSRLNFMNIDDVADIINSHYGVYQKDDIITDRVGLPCLITYIDKSDAETLHEVKYHVIYQGGITGILFIDDIITKLGTYNDSICSIDAVLGKYFDDELERIDNDAKTIV